MEQKIRLPPRPLKNDLKNYFASKGPLVAPNRTSDIKVIGPSFTIEKDLCREPSESLAEKLPEKLAEELKPTKQAKSELFFDDFMREDAFCKCQQWFKTNASDKPLLLIGPCGSGKTALIHHYSNGRLDYYEEDLEDEFLSSHGLRAKVPAVFDAIESLDPSARAKIRKAFVWPSRRPMIFTSEDAFAEPTKTWAKFCTVINLDKPSKSFISRVLKALQPDLDQTKLSDIIDMCNGNLSTAKNALFWTTTKTMFTESPLDVPKTTRLLLCGSKVSCIGDAPYLLHQLQINTVPVAALQNLPIEKLARNLDQYSFMDLQECRHVMDTDSIWSSMQLIVENGPQLNQALKSKFRFEWPRSLKPLEKFTMPYY